MGNTDTSRNNLIQNQANTAQINPANDPNSPLVQNLNTAVNNLKAFQTNQAGIFGAQETGDETLGASLGAEGAFTKANSSKLQYLQDAVTQSQAALNTAVASYQAQTNAQNQVTTQTQPSNQTQQVGQGTTVLNSGNQPVVTTPTTVTPGSAVFNPTPTTYGSNTTGGTNPNTYTIKSGDTFYALAGGDQAKIAAIEKANPGVNPNNLQVGQSINMPSNGNGTGANTTGTLVGSPFTAGVVAGQQQVGSQTATQSAALYQARSVQSQVVSELQAHPELNSSPASFVNTLNQWVNSKQVPSGPYVNLLNDLQEYANTIAPALGVGGTPTDNKTYIANSMIPMLASGETITQVLDNLDSLAVGKINKSVQQGSTLGGTVVPQAPTNIGGSMGGSSTPQYGGTAWQ